jgi:N-acetylmuramoyl-L-alanine amidase
VPTCVGQFVNVLLAAGISSSRVGAFDMRFGALVSCIAYSLALATSAGSDLKPRVALDIGHSIKQPGAYSARGVGEYYFNRAIAAALLRSLLRTGEVEAFIINPQGKPISLAERTREAANKGATLFLSIHHDSVQRRYVKEWNVDGKTHLYSDKFSGFSVFVSRKNRKFAQSQRLARFLSQAMLARGFSPTLHHAEKIPGEGRNLVDKDLGLYEFGDLIVLKTAAMPAVLLECGVIINRTEEASLQKPEIQQRIADAATEAIIKFVRAHAALGKEEARKAPENL